MLHQALASVAGGHEHTRAVRTDFFHVGQRQQWREKTQADQAVKHALCDTLGIDQAASSIHRRLAAECGELSINQRATRW